MHTGFLRPCVWIALLTLICLLILTAVARALPAPEIVFEDTLQLGEFIKSLRLDTVHFAEPTVIVSSWNPEESTSHVYAIRVQPLEIAETLFTFEGVQTYLAVPGHFNDDGLLDYALAHWQDSNMVVFYHGPGFAPVDTLVMPRAVRDLVVDDSSHGFWVGLARDTITPFVVGEIVLADWYYYLGSILHYQSAADTPVSLGTKQAGMDLRLVDVEGDGPREFVAFWQRFFFVLDLGGGGPSPDERWAGLLTATDQDSVLLNVEWVYVGDYWSGGSEPWAIIYFYRPVPITDVDGDGTPEAVFSWRKQWVGYPSTGIEVRSLASGQALWAQQLNDLGGTIPVSTCWELDGDGLPDILMLAADPEAPSGTALTGLKGLTGDTLFTRDVDFQHWDKVMLSFQRPGASDYTGLMQAWTGDGSILYRFGLEGLSVAVGERSPGTPQTFALDQNVPNPFNAGTRIAYRLDEPAVVALTVHDVLGRRVRTLADGPRPAGTHVVDWDGTDERGRRVGSGVYFCRLAVGDRIETRKMLLLR